MTLTARRKPRARLSPELVIGAVIVLGLAAVSVAYSVLGVGAPYRSGDHSLALPSLEHPLGTDNLGRDSLSRLVIAAGSTILISAAATAIAMTLGVVLGLGAGYGSRVADNVIMRVCDVLLSIPAILVALMVRVIFGPGTLPLIIAMGVVYTPMFARVMRAPTLVLKQRDFVLASEMAGLPKPLVAVRHILPNSITPVLVQAAATASEIVLLEAALSYLGQGVQPPAPSAGRMISEFQKFLQTDPILVLFPAMLIVLISVGWNLVADGIQAITAHARLVDFPAKRRHLINLVPLRASVLLAARTERLQLQTGELP
jgi:peptide/nickel transport system permease protein